MMGEETYQFINIPTPVLASHHRVGHSVSRLEVPVHVSGLFLLTFFICVEASSALVAWLAKFFIETENEMGSRSNNTLAGKLEVWLPDLQLERGRFQHNIVGDFRQWRSGGIWRSVDEWSWGESKW
jgi:hypothetical protein